MVYTLEDNTVAPYKSCTDLCKENGKICIDSHVWHFLLSSSKNFFRDWFSFIKSRHSEIFSRIFLTILLMLFFFWIAQWTMLVNKRCTSHFCAFLHKKVSKLRNCFASLKKTSMENLLRYNLTINFPVNFSVFVVRKIGLSCTPSFEAITLSTPYVLKLNVTS